MQNSYRKSDMKYTVLGWIGGILIVLAIIFSTNSCRAYQIDNCKESGGRPVTHSLLSGTWQSVGCLK